MNQATAYCIKGPDGELYEDSVCSNDQDCMHDFYNYVGTPWDDLLQQRYSCIRVEIKEIEE